MSATIEVRPIGVVRSRFTERTGVPIQTSAALEERGRIELRPELVRGLADLAGFEYLFLLTHFHLGKEESLEVVPFLDAVARGVFATRAPNRPNRIGLSIVRLLSIEGAVIEFAGNDMVDGTPVLDIKPYVPAFDARDTDRVGWFAGRLHALAGRLSDDRMGR